MQNHAASDRLPDFEQLLADVASRLAGRSGDAMDAAITDALRGLCSMMGAERSTLIEFSDDGQRFDTSHWWAAEGIPPTGAIDAERVPWYVARLRAGDTIAIERLPDDLPAGTEGERALAASYGMKSNLTVPIIVGGRPVCALATGSFSEYRRWSPSIVQRVRLFGQVLAAAVHRRRQERALERSRAEIGRLNRQLRRENLYLREEIRIDRHAGEIVGSSPGMERALAAVAQVAPLNSTVLLLGETGTGKELLARAIHDRSSRRLGPLVKVNCAALPPGLVESELFGHEKGAFTGATANRAGRFEVADRGTLFLDEVGDLPSDVQAKLLRVLQEGEFERVGSSRTRHVNVRLIAATHRDLETEIADGRFRADLYYRLSVFPIPIPPLRERREDIEALVWFFIHRRQRELERRIETIHPESLDALRRYDWPGNVRELENVVERAMILSSDATLDLDRGFQATARPASAQTGRDLDGVQRAHIEAVLAECGWRINGPGNAAERLALHPNTLRFRMKKLGIRRPSGRTRGGSRT
jgi:formate hydrogenlyase transcriptional activator